MKLYSTYEAGVQAAIELPAGSQLSQPVVVPNESAVKIVQILMKRDSAMVDPATLLIGTTAWDDDILTVELSSGLMTTDGYSRISVPCDIVLPSGTCYFTIKPGSTGVLTVKTLASAPSPQGGWQVSGLSVKDANGTVTVEANVLCVELFSEYDNIREVGKPDIYRNTADTWYKVEEQAALAALYPADIPLENRWVIDDYALPVNPSLCTLNEQCVINDHPTLDSRNIYVIEMCGSSPRVITGYQIELDFGKIGRDFAMWMKSYADFNRTFYAEIKLLDPEYPEVCHMGEAATDPLYLKRYFGTLSHWKPDASTISVYVNGTEVGPDYTVDYTNGSITFDTALALTDVVQVSYVWRPRVKLSIEPSWKPARGYIVAGPKVTLMEVDEYE